MTTQPENKQIAADKWTTMTISELYAQKLILNDRLSAAAQVSNLPMYNQIQRGMIELDRIIQQKSAGNNTGVVI